MPANVRTMSIGQAVGVVPTADEVAARSESHLLPIVAEPERLADGTYPDSLRRRISRAVAYSFRSRSAYSYEDRLDAEAELLARAMAKLTGDDGSTPRRVSARPEGPAEANGRWPRTLDPAPRQSVRRPLRGDPSYSLSTFYGQASNLRRKLDAERDHSSHVEDLAALEHFDSAPVALDSTLSGQEASDARREAQRIADRMRLPVFDLLYSCIRSATPDAQLPAEQVPAELGCEPEAFRKRRQRQAKLLAAECDPSELVRYLRHGAEPRSGHLAGAHWCPVRLRGAQSLIWAAPEHDASTAQLMAAPGGEAPRLGHTWTGRALREQSARWREGTANGQRPERPADKASADAVCAVSIDPSARREGAQAVSLADAADTLRSLSFSR